MTRLCPACWTNPLSSGARVCRTCWARGKRRESSRNDVHVRVRPSYRVMLEQLADRRHESMTHTFERLIADAWQREGWPVEKGNAA